MNDPSPERYGQMDAILSFGLIPRRGRFLRNYSLHNKVKSIQNKILFGSYGNALLSTWQLRKKYII